MLSLKICLTIRDGLAWHSEIYNIEPNIASPPAQGYVVSMVCGIEAVGFQFEEEEHTLWFFFFHGAQSPW